MSIRNPRPKKCLEHKPTSQTIIFCDEFISLTSIAFMTNISVSSVSMIFSGKREPSLKAAEKIAKALGMGLEEFLKGLKEDVSIRKRYQSASSRPNQSAHPLGTDGPRTSAGL
jgi:transcriptional regulator with XRE-family HTH domain